MANLMLLTDGYKLAHKDQYPEGTSQVLSNFTPRSSRIDGVDKVVFFGLQYFLQKYLTDSYWFMRSDSSLEFNRMIREHKEKTYGEFLESYFGPVGAKAIGTKHIGDLHDLGYIPLRFCAVPEGTHVPLRVPMFTVENTHPDFFWLTNYFETLMSSVIWPMCTSATTAARYRSLFNNYAEKTGGQKEFVPWQGHDFSFRGMPGPEAAALSGSGHLLSFTGTDSLPAISLLKDYYGAYGLVGGSVPATEHAVMCAGGKESELETFKRLLVLYPTGILSVVSDTWDFWHVVNVILPQLKNEIMARDGKLVIRPDSGDPVKIICGDPDAAPGSPEKSGLVLELAKIFGASTNKAGFWELDPHIGCIYGDSITYERAEEINRRLADKYFCSTNWVAGIGSYTYQYVTRDTYGFAIKATWARVNGVEVEMFKDPKTDNGTKKSAKGRMVVVRDKAGELSLRDSLTQEGENNYRLNYPDWVVMNPVWENGKFLREYTLDEVRKNISAS